MVAEKARMGFSPEIFSKFNSNNVPTLAIKSHCGFFCFLGSFGVHYIGICCLLCSSVAKILQLRQLLCVVPSELVGGT